MIYLASPYSHSNPAVMEERFESACIVAGELMKVGEHVFSPVAHSRPIANLVDLPHDFEFWAKYDTQMISLCDEVVVLTLPGWEESRGVAAEIKIAEELGKPVRYFERIPA